MRVSYRTLICILIVLIAVQLGAQTKRPYNNLLITEARISATPQNYVEFTNMGTETIDLSQFEFGYIGPWTQPWTPDFNAHFMLPEKSLAPGKSFVIAVGSDHEPEMWLKDPLHYSERVTKPEFYNIADMILHMPEINSTPSDSITPKWETMDGWNGRGCWYLRHHFINDAGLKDSMIIDQMGGIFDESDGTSIDGPHDVAGIRNATNNCILIRKNSIKTGITEFSSTQANADAAKLEFINAAGLDIETSEWIPVPILGFDYPVSFNEGWRAVFWTTGNQVNAKMDANTLVPKKDKVIVDLSAGTITVPWGVRKNDSVMYQFYRKPGLAWGYDYAPNKEDSAFISARTGDRLTIYACGDQATIKEFTINVLPPTPDDNIVIPKARMNYNRMIYGKWVEAYNGMRITDGISGMDTISHLNFATRVDTIFKYLEKAPKATWKIDFKDGIARPDLKTGDFLSVSSESGKIKKYFLKLEKYVPGDNAYLSSITWPDMPNWFKGAKSVSYGWAGDTIPGFIPSKNEYVVTIPKDYTGIPTLAFQKQHPNAKVSVSRAKTLNGTLEERTVTFTVRAENDTIINVYHVRFEKEKDQANIQPFIAEPFISQLIFQEFWINSWVEIVNPGTEPLDLSHYMIATGYGGPEVFTWWNTPNDYSASAYRKYVPGKKWQNEVSWAVQPRILETDFAVNPIVKPGDVFVMAQVGDGESLKAGYGKEIDVNFATGKNHWGFNMPWANAIHDWCGGTYYFYKILNDSVVNGLKPAIDINDFKLIEVFGGGSDMSDWRIGGETVQQITSYFRKPQIWKGNPEFKGSFGTNKDDCEWYWTNQAYYVKLNYGWPDQVVKVVDGIGSHIMNDVTLYRSTVASKVYKVSLGYSESETIRGVKSGTTVNDFYANIIKADANQSLKVISSTTGNVLTTIDAINNNDVLVVVSADQTNTSKYKLEVTANGLLSNAILTSSQFTVQVNGSTGLITGFNKNTTIKTLLEGILIPQGATLTVIDENDGYVSLVKLNYASTYIDVFATDKIFFEVIAENGLNKIIYQLLPISTPDEAYVTSDMYSVNQISSTIQYIPIGSSVSTLLSNVFPVSGATAMVYDKAGFRREIGDIYGDDHLVVTSANSLKTTTYALNMLDINMPMIQDYITSYIYNINQSTRIISGNIYENSTIIEFLSNLIISEGSTVSIVNSNGVVKTTADLDKGDRVKVTLENGYSEIYYTIDVQPLVISYSHFIPVWTGNGTEQMNINVVSAKIEGLDLQVGDEIGIFDGTKCVGAGIVSGKISSNNLLEMVVSMNDGSGNGYSPGNKITYKFYNKGKDIELSTINASYYNTNPTWSSNGIYEIGATAFVDLTGYNMHFTPIWSGNGYDHMNINIYSATLDGTELEAGDEIGIFDGNNCVGVGVLFAPISNVNTLDLVVSRNDGSNNGYNPGNSITYRFYDKSKGEEIPTVSAVYNNFDPSWSTDGKFAIGVTAFAALNGVTKVTQDISLNSGWNIISTNIIPSNVNLKDIFQSLINQGRLKKVMDETGKTIEDFGIFGGWKNNIGNLNLSRGYKVNVTAASTLSLEGLPFPLPYDLPLNAGWNIISYPSSNIQDAKAMVQTLIDQGKLKKVMDESGKTIEDFGIFGGWKNNIGNFLPGKGFKVCVKENCMLTIPAYGNKSAVIIPEQLASEHFKPVFTGNGTDHMNINLVNLQESGLQASDQIGVFDGQNCVGSVTIGLVQLTEGSISIAASANDGMEQTINGFIPNHGIKLYLYRNGQTYQLNFEKISGTEAFEKNGSLFATANTNELTKTDILTDNISFKCYPNPFTDEISIEIENFKQERITVEIFNMAGQIVKNLYQGEQTRHLVLRWNGTNDANQRVSPGIYLCKVNGQTSQILLDGRN